VFSHVFVSVTDFERALAFYSAVMDSLGIEQLCVACHEPAGS
jgi:catechol 2,3-dioxygenase-like lactoylglutathione lyase family enzyme